MDCVKLTSAGKAPSAAAPPSPLQLWPPIPELKDHEWPQAGPRPSGEPEGVGGRRATPSPLGAPVQHILEDFFFFSPSHVIKYLLKEGVKEYVLQLLPVSSRLFGAVDRQELGALVRTSLVCTADWSMK